MTPFEREWIQKVKTALLEKKGIDLNKMKGFGPRAPTETVVEGT